jgi:hypothetical protein
MMIFDPTDFDDPVVPTANWIHLVLQGVLTRRRARPTSLAHLPPRLLEDIGVYRPHPDMPPRSRR